MIVRTKEEIMNSMISNFAFDVPIYEGTFTYAIFSAVANAIAREYSIKNEEEKQIFLVDGRAEYLDKRAGEFGYDRKDGEQAYGDVIFEGEPGILVSDGLNLKCNNIEFVVSEGCTIGDNREGRAVVKAKEVGASGNIKAGSDFICDDISFDRVFAENDFKNGIDVESDEDFYTRFFYTQRNKGTSGNEDNYNEWARSIDGIIDAKTTGLKNGPGTVEVVVASKENVVDENTLKIVRNHIEQVRPIGASVTVKSMTDFAVDINIRVKSGLDAESIKQKYVSLANTYFDTCKNEIVYSKLYSILASMDDVSDVIAFEVNSGNSNISISTEQKAKTQNVSVEVVANV